LHVIYATLESDMKQTIIAISLAATALILAGCASGPTFPETPKQPIQDSRIVPSVRIGSAVLGMTEANLLDWLGQPNGSIFGSGPIFRFTDGDVQYAYDNLGLSMRFEAGKAIIITTTNSRYASADGVSVGSNELELRARWGNPTWADRVESCGDSRCSWQKLEFMRYRFANGVCVQVDGNTQRITVMTLTAYGRC
jgi:hypothetical protein